MVLQMLLQRSKKFCKLLMVWKLVHSVFWKTVVLSLQINFKTWISIQSISVFNLLLQCRLIQLLHPVITCYIKQLTALWLQDLSPKRRQKLIYYMEWRSVIKEFASVWNHRWGPWSHLLAPRSKFFTCSRVTVQLVTQTRNKSILRTLAIFRTFQKLKLSFQRYPVRCRKWTIILKFSKSVVILV